MISRLLHYSSQRARPLLIAELALIVVTAVLQGFAFLILVPLLRALFEGDDEAVATCLVAMTVVTIAYATTFWFASQLGMRASTAVLSSLLEHLGDRLVEMPIAWFSTDRSGKLTEMATKGAMFVSTTPYAVVRLILTGFITPATVLVGMYFFDWRLALAMTVSVPIIWLAYRWLRGGMERSDADHAVAVGAASSRIIEFSRAQPTLRTAADRSISNRLIEEALHDQHSAYRGLLVTGGTAIAAFGGIVQLALTVVIVLGAYLTIGGSIDVATLIALLVLGVRFTEPISEAGAMGGGVAVARTTLAQLDALGAAPKLPEPEAPAEPSDWGVRFEDVTFGYGGDPVLERLSFEAPAGKMTAIVGPSGSGKTTITRLIARFYDPDHGTVKIGGQTLPAIGTSAVEAAVAPVFQDVYLFDDSIINNVWLGNPGLAREQVIEAATRARVDEIATRLPGGWDARVGEGGSNLSGGERQRVSIARALLKEAPIVLLDEATAALDIGNELAVGAAIDAIRQDRTIVIVAHRLRTIVSADLIVMLDGQGRVAETGTHDELLRRGGRYAGYWRERVSASGWQLASE